MKTEKEITEFLQEELEKAIRQNHRANDRNDHKSIDYWFDVVGTIERIAYGIGVKVSEKGLPLYYVRDKEVHKTRKKGGE